MEWQKRGSSNCHA